MIWFGLLVVLVVLGIAFFILAGIALLSLAVVYGIVAAIHGVSVAALRTKSSDIPKAAAEYPKKIAQIVTAVILLGLLVIDFVLIGPWVYEEYKDADNFVILGVNAFAPIMGGILLVSYLYEIFFKWGARREFVEARKAFMAWRYRRVP